MVPTRNEVQEKINQIKKDPSWSTIRVDLVTRLVQWLIEIKCPDKDQEKILDDLDSYQ